MAARILTVDDNAVMLELFREILTEEGYEVIGSTTAPHSSTEIERMKPDLIILDYTCVARWGEPISLTWLPHNSQIPLILCTAASEQVRGTRTALKAAGLLLLAKPFDIEELLETVRSALPPQNPPIGALLSTFLTPIYGATLCDGWDFVLPQLSFVKR